MDNDIFSAAAKKAFVRKLGYQLFLAVVGLLGWLACTSFMVMVMDDADISKIYAVITAVPFIIAVTVIVIKQRNAYGKCLSFINDIPAVERQMMSANAVMRYETYIKSGDYWFIPDNYRFIKAADIASVKPLLHYTRGLFDYITLHIDLKGEIIKVKVRRSREMKNDIERIDFEW